MQGEFIEVCEERERVVHQGHTGVIIQEYFTSPYEILLSPFSFRNSQLESIKYLLLPTPSSIFAFVAFAFAICRLQLAIAFLQYAIHSA